ncbi:MAG: phosphatase PAP2 family protein [Ilumatobacteraceae bacterium]
MSDSRSSRLAALDAWFDRLLEPTRNFKPTIWLFTTATALGDFGILWHIVGIVRAVADTSRVKQALILSALMGVESLLLNQGIKPFFKRERPTVKGDSRFKIRKPRTSSFPSGHASSAFFAAVVLTRWSSWPAITAWFVFAVIVATSRVAVRIHHATDIFAGALIGTAMGLLAHLAISIF